MITLIKLIFISTILFSQCLYATSVEEYVKVCTDNQANKMGTELCECMGNKGNKLSAEEFEFFYAIAAKDQEKVNTGHATLNANQKVNVMTLSMMGPSKCASELATQQDSSDTQNTSENQPGANSAIASEAADDSASQ